jgi:hypothetical protein
MDTFTAPLQQRSAKRPVASIRGAVNSATLARMNARNLVLVGLSAVSFLVGCEDGGSAAAGGGPGSGGGAAGPSTGPSMGGDGTGGGGASTPLGESITLTIEAFDVQPGTERQVCKHFNLPADVPFDAVRFHSKMEGTSHHLNVYKLLSDVDAPVNPADAVVHDCQPASEQLSGDAAYIFGSATPERTVDLPLGVAFHLVPQQRIILEQHVINATPDVIQGGVTFDMSKPADDITIEHHADVIWFADWNFAIPPNQETVETSHCTVPYDVNVFGLMSHTHALGSHFAIEKWSNGETEPLYESVDWAHPVYQSFDPHLTLAAGEGLQWTCTWNNTTGSLVFPGKNSTDEMCMTFAYAYPVEGLSGAPIQCNLF